MKFSGAAAHPLIGEAHVEYGKQHKQWGHWPVRHGLLRLAVQARAPGMCIVTSGNYLITLQQVADKLQVLRETVAKWVHKCTKGSACVYP